jgi:plasmid stability protein
MMSNLHDPGSASEELVLDNLASELQEALDASASQHGRSIHEEAESIIRFHLSGGDAPPRGT